MSGPKVVNLEAVRRRRQRESLVGTRKLRDAIVDWRNTMKDAGQLTDSAIAEAEVILARMEAMRNSEQWDALFKELAARQAFFRDHSASAQQISIDKVASLHERRRRVQLTIAMLRRELQLAGQALPPELEDFSAGASDETNILQMEDLAQRCLAKLPAQQKPDITAHQRELAAALNEHNGAPVKFDDWLKTQSGETAMHQAKNDRLSRALAELQLRAPAESVVPLLQKARAIADEASAERRLLLTDSLLIEADEHCRHLRERKRAKEQLSEVLADLEPFQTVEAAAWRQRLEVAAANPSLRAVGELVAAAKKWCAEESALEEAVLRREAVLKALASLGYEVREGMATAWAENGRVIVRRPSDPNYGIELASASTGASVQARVVAFGDTERSAQSAQRDLEIEMSWCGDFHQVRSLIETDGFQPTLLHAKAAGEVPMKVVPHTEQDRRTTRGSSEPSRSRRVS